MLLLNKVSGMLLSLIKACMQIPAKVSGLLFSALVGWLLLFPEVGLLLLPLNINWLLGFQEMGWLLLLPVKSSALLTPFGSWLSLVGEKFGLQLAQEESTLVM